MSGILKITHGLPGSGKSTEAEKERSRDPQNIIRSNRDDIRTTLFGQSYHSRGPVKKKEQQVSDVQHEIISKGLFLNKKVIVDDTNLNPYRLKQLKALADKYNASFEQEYFNVSVEECKRRNKKRGSEGGREVPEFVIDQMSSKSYDKDGNLKEFIQNPSNGEFFAVSFNTPGMKKIDKYNKSLQMINPYLGKDVVFVDLDGSLTNNAHHAAYAFGDPDKKRNYHFFHKESGNAPVNEHVLKLIKNMRSEGLNLVSLSGRSDAYADETIKFLKRHNAPISELILKRDQDQRRDIYFKKEILDKFQNNGFTVVNAIDDRPQVLEMWHREGINTTIVPYIEPQKFLVVPDPYNAPIPATYYGNGICIKCGKSFKGEGMLGPTCRTKV